MWSEDQFKAWRARPETKEFFAFLKDRREALKEMWAEGHEMSAQDQALVVVYGDITKLDYDEDIAPFYQEENDDAE